MRVPDPFLYFDFRVWLRDALVSMSYSELITQVGLKSKGHITQILQGQKNLPPLLAIKFAKAFALDGRKRDFFLAMVDFTQAKTHSDKKIQLDRMVSLLAQEGQHLSPKHYDLCKHWYYLVVRELVQVTPVYEDYHALGKMVNPPITARVAEEAVNALLKMGLILRGPKGRLIQVDSMLTFGEGWDSVVVREFQHQALDLQKQALDRFTPEQREIANATLSMSSKRAALVQRRVKEFRAEMIALVQSDPDKSEQVFQLNLGFFPLSSLREPRS